MKRCKFLIIVLLCLLIVSTLPPVIVLAAGGIDLHRDIGLTVTERYNDVGLSGVTFDIYLVSTVDEYGELTPVDAFQKFASGLDIRGENNEAWAAMAKSLELDIRSGSGEKLQPTDSGVTGEDGTVSFPSEGKTLIPGLYLVMGTRVERDNYVYATSPFFVSLPSRNAETDTWDYAVEVNAKPEETPAIGDLRVLKIWQDDGHASQRPQSISIQLFCDNVPYGDPITLPQNGRWEYTWEALEMNHIWTVTEAKVNGYRTEEIRQEGNTFIVTNTYEEPTPPDEPDPSLPQGGQLWWPVSVLLIAGLLLIVMGLLLRRRRTNDET